MVVVLVDKSTGKQWSQIERRDAQRGGEWSWRQKETVGLTFVVAGGKHSLVCRTGANVPYLPSLVQKDRLINDVILIIKVNDVDLKERREMRRMKKKNTPHHGTHSGAEM